MAGLLNRVAKLAQRLSPTPKGPPRLTDLEKHQNWVRVSLTVLLDNCFNGAWPASDDDVLDAAWNCGASLLRVCATLHDDHGETDHAASLRERADVLDATLPEWADLSRVCAPGDVKRFATWQEKLAWVRLHGSPYATERDRAQSHINWRYDPASAHVDRL